MTSQQKTKKPPPTKAFHNYSRVFPNDFPSFSLHIFFPSAPEAKSKGQNPRHCSKVKQPKSHRAALKTSSRDHHRKNTGFPGKFPRGCCFFVGVFGWFLKLTRTLLELLFFDDFMSMLINHIIQGGQYDFCCHSSTLQPKDRGQHIRVKRQQTPTSLLDPFRKRRCEMEIGERSRAAP